ncbi:hypothetical protein C488_17703 [Natrinema pellirubrum DSM 15624]|uniref:Probable inorganic carbon transporter subunit DabA n=1 Tax=Natrinema pellirubrum (strain DSM 15624 / CIP 106293 / JCM 10476 / NCIMB 786 / 157) TaxID=797303 RepID=L0JSR6_NATP1|nr:DUF2309 domain-containing protein [Natrinema pellirubrum]AGB33416.1 hypothetical protein Natpe_3651 [Natrinema pellirubrum DSM 15624]ELY71244.1 hypothetical protein C488_17703 [Natrinema pellirubrum DSM 15624]
MTRNTDDARRIETSIDRAAERIGSVWPLHSFVTANPLSGFEDEPFHRAVAEAEELFGGRGYPHPSVFRRAWESGRIDADTLRAELASHGIERDPETLLEELADAEAARDAADPDDATEAVDRVLSKWLAAFLDEGQAKWPMPNREDGFYQAWRAVAPHDGDVPGPADADDLPETAIEALESALGDYPEGRWVEILEAHLAALPGWSGFITQRTDDAVDPWQEQYPITLAQYLAVRLTITDLLDAPIDLDAGDGIDADTDEVPLPEIWLTAWEKSYRERLLDGIDDAVTGPEAAGDGGRPAAQLVFCIDTRSEVIRRHVETQGPYETHGYAGFFGVPMRHRGYEAAADTDACPPIVEPEHRIVDRPADAESAAARDRWTGLATAARKHFKTLKSNLVAAFTFVEGAGSAYGSAMAARTLSPSTIATLESAIAERVPSRHEAAAPAVDYDAYDDHDHADHDLPQGMSHEAKVEYARNAFELMGWTEFARLVVFTGHASETTNNPFGSSLDCGACAGNPGGPNARVLAAICNDPDVKAALRDHGIDIPEDTVFLAGEHNTTTDEITLFDDDDVPESHRADLESLREDLARARAEAAAERTASADDEAAVNEVERKAADWAETRPEWGLAGNASFVIGPRELTADQDLDGRAFLHSYDWSVDPDGDALEAIVTGPLVVTQWINNQYYFATVDNGVYGSGSKVTQNPVGNVGVVQGNGGDLLTGLPLQSLKLDDERPFHQPLRLTAVIHAPRERVTEILRDHEDVRELLDNGWIGDLTVVDPERDNESFHYAGDLEWASHREEAIPEAATPTETTPVAESTADD